MQSSAGKPHVDVLQLQREMQAHQGLPPSFYSDPEIYKLDLDAIFRREWQYIGPSSQLSEPGDVIVGWAGNVPVVVTRADDGKLHGFVNVCRHRGYRVAEKNTKNCKRLVCRYHAWSYWLNGDLAYAPGSDSEADFPSDDLGLIEIAVDQFGPAVYVNVDKDAAPFLSIYAQLDEATQKLKVERDPGKFTFMRETFHDVQSNWKLWFDNFVECYHCDTIHRSTFATAYESTMDVAENNYYERFATSYFPPRQAKSKTELRANDYRSFIMFPGVFILQQDDLMILAQMRPTGPESTQQVCHYFGEAQADPAHVTRWIELWEETFAEDTEATAIQQEGLRCGMARPNRLLPAREQSVLFFNALILDAYGRHLHGPEWSARAAAE